MNARTLRLLSLAVLCSSIILAGCGGGGGSVTPPPSSSTITSVSVTCNPTSITTAQTSQCTAIVQGTGSYSSAVTWTASAGSVSSTGLFTPPTTAQQVTITAKSTQDTTKANSATVTVTMPSAITSVSVACNPTSITTAQTSQCTATVQGTGSYNSAVSWTASAGSVSSAGLFTPPTTAQQVTIRATSTQDTTKSNSATVTVTVPTNITGVTLSCPEPSLPEGLLEQCAATVQGTGTYNMAVNWTASVGSISAGLFTAPTTLGNVTITATAAGDSTKFATKTVNITTPQKATNFGYEGITHVAWWNNDYLNSNAVPSENALAATGVTWAGVLTTWYMPTSTSTTIAANFSTNTPTDAAVVSAISQLHSQGVKVMLKPHVDVSDGTWRGAIHPTDANAWFASFTAFILHYAQLAHDNNVEMLCIGTEYATMTGSDYQSNWTAVINAIRQVYSGKLVYAANATSTGDEFTSVSFWSQVDVIGLDGYFPLTNHADPTMAQLIAAWSNNKNGQNIVAAVSNFAGAHPTQPVVFTEIGYRSAAGANEAPWDYSASSGVDNTEQQNCYEAMFEVWTSQSGSPIKGYFWWDWPIAPPAVGDTDYNPRNKPAQTVLQNWQ
jgi:Glycoside Hydrolase Family 113